MNNKEKYWLVKVSAADDVKRVSRPIHKTYTHITRNSDATVGSDGEITWTHDNKLSDQPKITRHGGEAPDVESSHPDEVPLDTHPFFAKMKAMRPPPPPSKLDSITKSLTALGRTAQAMTKIPQALGHTAQVIQGVTAPIRGLRSTYRNFVARRMRAKMNEGLEKLKKVDVGQSFKNLFKKKK
jgi:hypothetical protein